MNARALRQGEAMLSRTLPKIILASQSPARKMVLEAEGIEVTVRPTWAHEEHSCTDARDVVTTLSRRKLDSALAQNGETLLPVLACDTIIAIDGDLMGKPSSVEEARLQLKRLCRGTQEVWSAWALYRDGAVIGGADMAIVHFKALDDAAIEEYLALGEWMGAAGAYRIQGRGRSLIASIEGDENVIIGLPLAQMKRTLSGGLRPLPHL